MELATTAVIIVIIITNKPRKGGSIGSNDPEAQKGLKTGCSRHFACLKRDGIFAKRQHCSRASREEIALSYSTSAIQSSGRL